MKLHVDDICNQTILNHIRERVVFLFKQKSDLLQLVQHFQKQFSQSFDKAIEKYSGTP